MVKILPTREFAGERQTARLEKGGVVGQRPLAVGNFYVWNDHPEDHFAVREVVTRMDPPGLALPPPSRKLR